MSARRKFRVRLPRRRRKPDLIYMQAYEEAIILRDLTAWPVGARVSAAELRCRYPMRYGPKLSPVLNRMAKNGRLYKRRGSRYYSLPAEQEARVAA